MLVEVNIQLQQVEQYVNKLTIVYLELSHPNKIMISSYGMNLFLNLEIDR